jgi:carbonic anhydrase
VNRLAFVAGVLLASGSVYASGTHWGYSGAEGPEHWAKLSPEFSACSGKNQSPIDLSGFVEAYLDPIRFAYQAGGAEILNNGHTVQVNYAPGSTIELNGHTFELKQFHFHTPSENHVNGKSFPMEAHLVHADADGNYAVVAVVFEEGAPNEALESAWARMPEKVGDKNPISDPVSADLLLPQGHQYYRFNGSLTTPPCTEGVWWLVLKDPVSASKEQIERFSQVMGHPNNRPIQPVNARPVLE